MEFDFRGDKLRARPGQERDPDERVFIKSASTMIFYRRR